MARPHHLDRPAHPALIRAKLRRALHEIQEAQNGVGRALQELSPIIGALPTYSKGHKLYDQVHAYWYKVNALVERAEKLRLDHEPEASDYASYGLTRQEFEPAPPSPAPGVDVIDPPEGR